MARAVGVRVPIPAPRRSEIRSTPFQGGPFWGRLKTAFRSFAPPFQLEPAALGFELVFECYHIYLKKQLFLIAQSDNRVKLPIHLDDPHIR